MIECRKAHRSKSFIESRLETQVESQDVETDCSNFENKASFSLEGSSEIVRAIFSLNTIPLGTFQIGQFHDSKSIIIYFQPSKMKLELFNSD